jgi:hypothetical protein
MVTSFVLIMMLVIEYINVQTKGLWHVKLQKNRFLQIIIAAFLGIVPGCLGAFTVVSLYTHRMLSFAAVVTVMIASFGDEAFYMLSLIPQQAFMLMLLTFGIAIVVGFVILFFTKKTECTDCGFKVHQEVDKQNFFKWSIIKKQLKHISFVRFLLIMSFVVFGVLLATESIETHGEPWGWERITYLVGTVITLLISLTASEHFLEHHMWEHVIKKHSIKLFLWTLLAMLMIEFVPNFENINLWVEDKQILLLFLAVVIGIIPESGPNLVFITLYMTGNIPFSILLANSIVQDGHGALPLFAESKRDFVKVKLINALVGLVFGYIGLTFF